MPAARSRPTVAEIDLRALAHNVETLAAVSAPAALCAVVKGDGYGHGAVPVARTALESGASSLAVAVAEEGVQLRDAGIEAPVLVLSEPSPAGRDAAVAAGLDLTVDRSETIDDLARRAHSAGRKVRVHLKVDTGMHRIGADPAAAAGLALRISAAPGLVLAGTWSHLPVADEVPSAYTLDQVKRFEAVLGDVEAAGVDPGLRHLANSAGAIAHPESRLDMVRCGIALYGIAPSPALAGLCDLRAVMSLRTEVSAVRRVAAGDGVSYGFRWRAPGDRWVATLPVGYADGLRRALSPAGATVLIGGRRRPIVGAVTMDQTMVDCGDDPVEVGAEVVLVGRQGAEHIRAEEWADLLGTIGYEIVCGVSSRVPRTYPDPEGEGS